jgi:hypothetical protein
MAAGTKKQHFVPKLLLRQFADAEERLFAYDMADDRSFPTTVDDAGHQNHFLTITELDGADGPGAHFESFFQQYEDPAKAAIRDIESAISSGVLAAISPSQREVLARFIALQYLRTPETRERAIQASEVSTRVIVTAFAESNGFDIADDGVQASIDSISTVPLGKHAVRHGEDLLRSEFVEELGKILARHVWVLNLNRTTAPFYIADNPVTLYPHVARPGRGIGLRSYGVEVSLPLSSTLQLSLVERRYVRDRNPTLESSDGCLLRALSLENVVHLRALQVGNARRFIYCARDDFTDAQEICDDDPELRDPNRRRMGGTQFDSPSAQGEGA